MFAHFSNPIGVCSVIKSCVFRILSWPDHQILSVSVPLILRPSCRAACRRGKKKATWGRASSISKRLREYYRYFLCSVKSVHWHRLYKVLWHANVNSHCCLHSWALKGIQSRKKTDRELTAGEFFLNKQPLVYRETSEHTEEGVNIVTILLHYVVPSTLNRQLLKKNCVEWHRNSTDLGQFIVTFNKCVHMPTL